ncbi:MAG: transposase [Motiliproteus sp.]
MKTHESVSLFQSEIGLQDPLTELLRSGAGELVSQAVEAEVQALLKQYEELRIEDGRHAIVRNGYLPARKLKSALGELKVRVPKVRDRSGSGVSFISRILPPYFKTSADNETSLAWHYLQGVLGGDFRDALVALLGSQIRSLRADTLSPLKENWRGSCKHAIPADLSSKRYVGWWANCVYSGGRRDDQQCLLVITGVTEQGGNELVAVQLGYRQSAESWEALLDSLRTRGLAMAPPLASGDGSLGFWPALSNQYPACRHQYCWGHKVVEVLDKLPDPMLPVAKKALGNIWMAQTVGQAHTIFDRTLMRLSSKCTKCSRCSEVADCLKKDRHVLLAFYDFPVEFWAYLRRPSLYSQPSLSSDPVSIECPGAVGRPRTWLWPVKSQC